MITIKKEANKVTIMGHANYSKKEDIVCASVSSIMYTTVNAMMRFEGNKVRFSDDGNKVIIEVLDDTVSSEILIVNMMSLLEELASQYPKNVKIESEEY